MDTKQRNLQVGRIHAAAKVLGIPDGEYRDLLQTLTGERSCSTMTDRQVNHALDWLNFLNGRRHKRPTAFGFFPGAGTPQANLARVAIAIANVVPPGYEVNPIRSPKWQLRVAGRACEDFGDFTAEELYKLIEGVKAIFRRAGCRDTETLDRLPLKAADKEEEALRADQRSLREHAEIAEEKACLKKA